MPIYELSCGGCGSEYETYHPHFDTPDPDCPQCGGKTERMPSKFKVVFTGDLSAGKYNDPKLEYANMEGHWGYLNKSGAPGERVWIDSWDKRKKFMRDEKLLGIEDVGHIEASEDGKFTSSGGRGSKGQWI